MILKVCKKNLQRHWHLTGTFIVELERVCIHRVVSASISVKTNLFKVNYKDAMKMAVDVVLLFLLLTLNRCMLTGVFLTLISDKCDRIRRKLLFIYLFIYLCDYVFIYSFNYLIIYLFIYLFIYLLYLD